jgi:hypothetical protein
VAVCHNANASSCHYRGFPKAKSSDSDNIVFKVCLVLFIKTVALYSVISAPVSESLLAMASAKDVDSVFSVVLEVLHQVLDVSVYNPDTAHIDSFLIHHSLVEFFVYFSRPSQETRACERVEF